MTFEFLASTLLVESEYSVKVLKERFREAFLNQSSSQTRFQLIEELIALDYLLVVIDNRLIDVHLDLVVEDRWQLFAHASVIQFDQPQVHCVLVAFLVFSIISLAAHENIIHEAHENREDQDAYEFNCHGKAVLNRSVALDISIADCGEGGAYPVEGDNVFELI